MNIDVTKKLIAAFGKSAQEKEIIKFVPDRAFNDVRYFIDSSKLHKLGWKPETNFEEGLKLTIAWYTEHAHHWDRTSLDSALRAHPIFTNPLTGQKQCQGKVLHDSSAAQSGSTGSPFKTVQRTQP